jgi:hypothetical protein
VNRLTGLLGASAVAGLLVVLPAHVAASATISPGLFHQVRLPASTGPRISANHVTGNLGWSSSNWSGYAITGSGFTSVTGKWTVPAVSASRRATYSSNWIGIDGFNNSNLIQTGTESDYYNGSTHYDAWWEILPAAETVIPSITVRPGDVMTASITQGSGSSWTITISDSRGGSFTTVQNYSGQQTSAEWIEEAPSIGGRIAPLANYGSATFDPGTANGGNPGLTGSDGGAMVQRGVQVSTPSNPDGDADGFNMAYGSTAPSPPST